MFNIDMKFEGCSIVGSILVDSYFFEKNNYDYAFYLYRNNERVDSRWYSRNMDVNFTIGDIDGIFYIKAFIRDLEYRNIRTFDSEKISIEH